MTARELAKKLMQHPDDIVCVTTDNFEQGHLVKEARGLGRFKGIKEKKTFRDAFDGETYTSDVITMSKGETMYVQIR